MAIPKRGDPRRPMFLAARSMRAMGIVLVGISVLGIVPILLMPARGLSIAMPSIAFYLVPGILYLLCGIFILRRQLWAVIIGLVLASIHTLGFAVIAGTLFLLAPSESSFHTIVLVVASVMVLFVLAFAQLIFHLSKSFEAIKYVPIDEQRGFEPLMARPVIAEPRDTGTSAPQSSPD